MHNKKAIVVVNVASKCGYTHSNYLALNQIYSDYKDKGVQILAFPCNQFGHQEPGNEAAINEFCSTKYSVKFPLFSKIDVNGPSTHPLYQKLK